MKLRFPPKLKTDLEARADLLKISGAELIRRAIKKHNRTVDAGERVALGENEERATRENSTPGEYELRGLEFTLSHRDIFKIVRWALDATEPEKVELSQEAKAEQAELERRAKAFKARAWRVER